MLEPRNGLLDADRGYVQLRHVGRQIGIALIGADDDAAGLGNSKVAAGHTGIGGGAKGSVRFARGFGEVVHVAVVGTGADGLANTCATSVLSLCTAGTTTWLGSSLSSCWMRSPRSVSITSMPTEAM